MSHEDVVIHGFWNLRVGSRFLSAGGGDGVNFTVSYPKIGSYRRRFTSHSGGSRSFQTQLGM